VRLALALLSLSLLACSVDLAEGHYRCTTADECPSGWSCSAGACYSHPFDAGPADTGAIDTGTRDASAHDAGRDAFVRPDVGVDTGPIDAGVDAFVPPTVAAIAAGANHTCAIDTAGATYCWGDNGTGQLGLGSTPSLATSAMLVPTAPTGALQVEAAYNATCVRTATDVYCWGQNNWFGNYGVIGRSDRGNALLPVPVDLGGAGVEQITLGLAHACARLSTGELTCWGLNSNGQLGLGDTADTHPTPTLVLAIEDVVDVCAGGLFTCAVLASGAVECWGDDASGQLGRGTTSTTAQTSPAPSLITSGAVSIACGYRHACAVVTAGSTTELQCWGSDAQGEVGVAPTSSVPTPTVVPDVVEPVVLALGGRDPVFVAVEGVSCATAGAGLSCWGSNDMGQLGRGATVPRQTAMPGPVSSLSGTVLDADVGYTHACAIETITGGTRARCWGSGTSGALGDGLRLDSAAPVTVSGLP
jgi:alpha-tubulin suppressor-like RCC1 family protein